MTFDHEFSNGASTTFRYALIVSIIFHAAVVANWPFYGRLFSAKDRFREIEITYVRAKEPPMAAPKKPESVAQKSQPRVESAQPAKIISETIPQAGQPKKSDTAAPRKDIAEVKKEEVKIEKKAVAEKRATVVIKQPIIPKIDATTSVDLKDLRLVPPSYAQTVRSRIIDNLNPEYSQSDGDVFVRFVITEKGELKDINIIDDKSSKDGLLRRAAFEAIRDSSPFPGFPNDVTASEITFACHISFIRK